MAFYFPPFDGTKIAHLPPNFTGFEPLGNPALEGF
jgi:hypothetical protein